MTCEITFYCDDCERFACRTIRTAKMFKLELRQLIIRGWYYEGGELLCGDCADDRGQRNEEAKAYD